MPATRGVSFSTASKIAPMPSQTLTTKTTLVGVSGDGLREDGGAATWVRQGVGRPGVDVGRAQGRGEGAGHLARDQGGFPGCAGVGGAWGVVDAVGETV